MDQQGLFGEAGGGGDAGKREQARRERLQSLRPRLVTVNRQQLELRPVDLDRIIGQDHPARLLWHAAERLDLSKFYEPIKARESEPGRTPTDPKVFVALWLYATSDGVGSARELEALCREHDAYRWLRGGVPLNDHTLSDFRTAHGAALDDLFTQVLGVMLHHDLIALTRVSQDGLRVRASAGTDSFRRRKSLKKCLKEARRQVERVKQLADDPEHRARQQAAQERAARERVERLKQAMEQLKKVEQQRAQQTGGRKATGEPRASTSDPEARNMRMGDGGHRPAHNVQLATETKNNVIVGVAVTNIGSDSGQALPMLEQVGQRTGQRPKEYLVDGGYTDKQTVDEMAAHHVTLYGPVVERWGQDPHATKMTDSAARAAWRKRMATPAAKEIYKERAQYSERVNADLKTRRTLSQFLVRGSEKVLCVVLWNALAYNLLRWLSVTGNA
jgi:transposase